MEVDQGSIQGDLDMTRVYRGRSLSRTRKLSVIRAVYRGRCLNPPRLQGEQPLNEKAKCNRSLKQQEIRLSNREGDPTLTQGEIRRSNSQTKRPYTETTKAKPLIQGRPRRQSNREACCFFIDHTTQTITIMQKKERLTAVRYVRFTEEEAELIDALSKQRCQTISQVLRYITRESGLLKPL